MVTTRTKVIKVKDKTRKVACSKCNRKTNHKVLTSVEYYWDASGDIQGYDYYETISCLGCDEISFRLASTNSDDIDMDEDGKYFNSETEELFPQRLIGRSLLSDLHLLPLKIRQIYRETHSALSSGLKILAGVGIGALIESICIEEQTKGFNLKERIEDLVKKGVLTQKSADILHETRFLRNRSAHEIEAATDTELSVAFDIMENLLQTVYIIPKKADGLKRIKTP